MSKINRATITTIIPTYRRPFLLKKAIESVLAQTYPNFELHIWDNASCDETEVISLEYCKKDPRIIYHQHKENIGAVANFSYALSQVKTDFFSFLSDDDLLLPHFYDEALKGFKKYPEAFFSCTAVIETNANKEIINLKTLLWKEKEFYKPPEGLYEMIPKHLDWIGILFKQEVRTKIGGIDETLKAIDVDFILRCAAHFPYVVSKVPSAIFIQHFGSYSQYAGTKLLFPGWFKIMKKIANDLVLTPEIKKTAQLLLQEDFEKKLFFTYIHCLKIKKFEECNKAIELFNNHLNQKKKAFFLILVLFFFRKITVLHWLLLFSLSARKLFLKHKRLLNKRFGILVPK